MHIAISYNLFCSKFTYVSSVFIFSTSARLWSQRLEFVTRSNIRKEYDRFNKPMEEQCTGTIKKWYIVSCWCGLNGIFVFHKAISAINYVSLDHRPIKQRELLIFGITYRSVDSSAVFSVVAATISTKIWCESSV